MTGLRVLLVSPVGELGGAEQVFLSLAKNLPSVGIEPIVACMRPGPLVERVRELGIEAYAFADHRFREPVRVLRGIQWLAALIRRTKPDLLHSNHMAHLYAAPAARLTGVPELWHLYDYPYQPDAVERLTFRLPAHSVVFMTGRVREGFPRLHSLPHSIIYPICVETDRLRSVVTVPEARARYGLSAAGPLFLTVARLQVHKGHQYLIDAVPAVLRSHPAAQFAVVGKASGPEQERYRDQLLAQAERLGVAPHVNFLGYVGDEDLVALYREADALVHPATSEGFGLILLEAMALGTPVIAAASDGPGEILADGVTGLLVPTRDSTALAAAMCRLLENEALSQSLRHEGPRHAATFRVEDTIRQTAEVYVKMKGGKV